ncbi:hypothetical protein HY468_03075 [Candidatus Roizmanbacteria bacterium]|nr:hypothetical protein [Candidatus Roizmanbacteria bacterium]
MDPAFHIVSGMVIAKALTGDHLVAGALMANLPDLISVPFSYTVKFRLARKDRLTHFLSDFKRFEQSGIAVSPDLMRVYHGAHNLFFWAIVSISLLVALPPPLAITLSLCHLSHLLTDVHSHEKDYASRPLYPLFTSSISGGRNWTSNKLVFFGSWGLLLIIAFFVLL